MEYSSFDFQQARVKQVLFKSQLRSVLYGVKEPDSDFFSPRHSPFGVWLHTVGRASYGNLTEVRELEQQLGALLRVAKDLYALYQQGKIEEARSSLNQIDPYNDKITALLQQMEQNAKAQKPI
jgi:hypothetical protein